MAVGVRIIFSYFVLLFYILSKCYKLFYFNFSSFDGANNFNTKKYKAIQEDVLALISGKTLAKKESWGAGK